jgi:hypothetical protein
VETLKKAVGAARRGLEAFVPAIGAVDAVRGYLSEAVAQRVHEEASRKAHDLMVQAHRKVMLTIIWQNGLLLLSLVPVYFLRSAVPFYIAYGGVAGNSLVSAYEYRSLLARLFRTRSITATLSHEVCDAIQQELTQRQAYERMIVQLVGPDLKSTAEEVARKLKPDVITAAANMAITLLLSFVAFRLFVIPLLEHKALLH